MVEYAESGISQKKFALGAFVDIQGVFDNVSIDLVIRDMREKNLPETFIKWYSS